MDCAGEPFRRDERGRIYDVFLSSRHSIELRRGCPYDPRGKARLIRKPGSSIENRRAAFFEINGRGLAGPNGCVV